MIKARADQDTEHEKFESEQLERSLIGIGRAHSFYRVSCWSSR